MATNGIDCYVKLPSGKTMSFILKHSDLVEKVYDNVAEELNVSKDRVLLKYTGKVIGRTKSHTVGYLGICKETILKAEVIQIQTLNIIVKLEDGKTVPVSIENISQVKYIKEHIESVEGIAPSHQVLKLGNRTLSNPSEKCMDAGITDEAVLTLKVQTPSKTTDPDDTSKEKEAEMDPDAKEAVLGSFDAEGRPVEVVFSFDTTGSMYGCLEQVRDKLKSTVTRLIQQIRGVRIGIVAHGDYCDYTTYVTKHVDLTSDVDALVKFVTDVERTSGGDSPEVRSRLKETVQRLVREVAGIRVGLIAHGDYLDYETYVVQSLDFTTDVERLQAFVKDAGRTMGGGDGGECYEWVLRQAQQLDWSEHSAKALVMIGDDVPHVVSFTNQHVNWHDELDVLKGLGVKVYGVKAEHSCQRNTAAFYQELADSTGGAYITFSNFAIIAEMFLAVCYKEASEAQFEEYQKEVTAEVAQGSKVAEDVKEVLQQIQRSEQNPQRDEKDKPYVAQPWWDPALDHGTPAYSYDTETGRWQHARSVQRSCATGSTGTHTTATVSRKASRLSRFSFRRKSRATSGSSCSKKSCVIM